MRTPADLASIQPALHRLHPTNVLEEVDVDALDAHLPHRRLMALLRDVSRTDGANAVLETDIVRSHILHVGRNDLPDWERFNRELTRSERLAVIEQSNGGLLFWSIRLSRVGPFWTEIWNLFQIRRGMAVPDVVARPETEIWAAIRKRVGQILRAQELLEIPPSLLKTRLPWLRRTQSATSEHSLPGESSTVYDALFSEIY